MKPVKIAQIGTGHDHALPTFASLLKNSDCFEVVGIAEPSSHRAGALESNSLYRSVPRLTVDQLLAMEDLEAVAVENEEHLSTAVALKFAQRGGGRPPGQAWNGRRQEL